MTSTTRQRRRRAWPLLGVLAMGVVLSGCDFLKPSEQLDIPMPGGAIPVARPLTLTYAHTVPGVYSEIFANLTGVAGEELFATLRGPGGTQVVQAVAGADGIAYFTFRITVPGRYTVSVDNDRGGSGFTSASITVDPPPQ